MKKMNVFSKIILIFSFVMLLCVMANAIEYDGYIVKLAEPIADFDTLSANTEITELECSENVYVVEDIETVNMLVDEGNVVYAEPNYVLELLDEEPNDTYYIEQWTLEAIKYSALYGTKYNGDGVTIAVIDSGLDITHPDFANIKLSDKSKNVLGNGSHPEAFYRDQVGHGTFVTSQIAASTNNNEGIASIAYGAEIMVIRAVAKKTSTKYPYDINYDNKSATVATVSGAIDYAVQNGADVINISLGITSNSSTLSSSIANAVSKGVIVVAAAGNTGSTDFYYPANCEGVIGVGSISRGSKGYTRSSFSQRNTSVDVVAPGGNVVGIQIYPSGSGEWYTSVSETYAYDGGTSYASPIVASFAAIAKQINPEIDSEGFLELLKETANDLGDEGYDTSYGYGYVDAEKFLDALVVEEVSVSVEEIAEGEVYESISMRASGADLALYDVTVSGIEETAVTIPCENENVFVYRVYGEYLVKTDFVYENGSIVFNAPSGVYTVSACPLVRYGDVNSDGDITLTDIIRVLKRTASDETVLDVAAADYNGDCMITVIDIICILNEMLVN